MDASVDPVLSHVRSSGDPFYMATDLVPQDRGGLIPLRPRSQARISRRLSHSPTKCSSHTRGRWAATRVTKPISMRGILHEPREGSPALPRGRDQGFDGSSCGGVGSDPGREGRTRATRIDPRTCDGARLAWFESHLDRRRLRLLSSFSAISRTARGLTAACFSSCRAAVIPTLSRTSPAASISVPRVIASSLEGVVTGHRWPSDTKEERAGWSCDRSRFIVASASCMVLLPKEAPWWA